MFSVVGTNRTCRDARSMVAIGGKADMERAFDVGPLLAAGWVELLTKPLMIHFISHPNNLDRGTGMPQGTRSSIVGEIEVSPQSLLDIYRCTSRRIGIGTASGHHPQRPVTLGTVIGDLVDRDVADIDTAGLLPDFCYRPRMQICH